MKNKFHQLNLGLLKFTGEDRLDFIQRQTTNDLTSLSATNPITTILTNSAGRVLDMLHCFDNEDNSISCIVSYPLKTFTFLKNKIFFMDDVEISDLTNTHTIFDLFSNIPVTEIKDFEQFPGGKEINFISNTRFVIESKSIGKFHDVLSNNNFFHLSDEEYALNRIDNFIPAPNHELVNKFNPLEINLSEYISSTKGCYTGQEVIARQINYKKITKTLGKFSVDNQVFPKDKIYQNNKLIGEITTCEKLGKISFIAMGVIKQKYNIQKTEITISSKDGKIRGRIK